MKFGIKTPPQHCTWQQMIDVWQAADAIDVFDSCWNFDHFYPLVGDQTGPCMEAWVTLSALAAQTKRVRVGCMVQGAPYRHPAITANMAASLDIISGGRLNLGLGAGWHEDECAAYGIDLLPLKQRFDRFEEAVQIIKSLLTAERTDFDGTFYQIKDALCEPKGPQKGGPPIVIGGGGEKRTLNIVARFADHWNLPFAQPDQFRAKHDILLKHCEQEGRKAEEIECSVQIALPADEPAEQSAANAAALGEAGVDTVLFTLRPPYDARIIEPLGRALDAL